MCQGPGCRVDGENLFLCAASLEDLRLGDWKGFGWWIFLSSGQDLNLPEQKWLNPGKGVLYQVSPDNYVVVGVPHLWP